MIRQDVLQIRQGKLSGSLPLTSDLVASGASQVDATASAASSALVNVQSMVSTVADVVSKEVPGNLPINLTAGTKFICLGFSNGIHCANSLPTTNLSHLATTLLNGIGKSLRSEIETFRRLSIVGTCLIVLAYLMVLLHILLPPERQALLRAKLSLSIAFLFGISSVIINIALPEWIFQETSNLTEKYKFVKPIMDADQSLQNAVTICAVCLLLLLSTTAWYSLYTK
jgi:hypothetical protein